MAVTQPWFAWAVGLLVGFPLSVVALNEVIRRLKRRGSAAVAPLRAVRDQALPVLAALLFALYVLDLPSTTTFVKVVATLFWIVAIYALLALLNTVLFTEAKDTRRANVPTLFRDLSRFILILVGIAIVLSAVWGFNLAGLLTALGVGSIVLGLALQDTLGNLFAGVALLFERPYSEGDWIQVEGTTGRVVAINWRATRLVTRDNDLVTIPNGTIAAGAVLNESAQDEPGYESYIIGFSYDDPPNKVKRIMLETVKATPGVLEVPPPLVRTISYDDFAITYQVRFAIQDFAQLPAITDAFATRIWYAAKRGGLAIPFPIRTLHHYEGEKLEQAAFESAYADGLSQLAEVTPFEPETDTQAELLSLRHFGSGEPILAEGERGEVLYLILAGEVGMTFETVAGEALEVTRLGQGELFGATTLLRGEPSRETFTALEDVETIALSPDAVMRMAERRPSFARALEELIETRSQTLEALKQQALSKTL